jgi:hypothetical protein
MIPLLFLLAWAAMAQPPASLFNVLAYGAKGDGKTNDAPAIQRAVDACAKAGGGVVYLPAGNFLSGTIVLKSNVTLHLSPGATLWGSRKIEDFKPPHLIYAENAENIGIDGSGTINGNGDAYWYPDFKPHERRPSPLIELVKCQDVRIHDVRIRNAPGWTIHPLDCQRVNIRGISIINNMRGPNTDGIDPDSTRDMMISDTYIEAGDDCIVLKTTGRTGQPVQPCENITVTNCSLVSDDAALKLGTESHADFRNIVFSNIAIRGTRVGAAIYAKDGGTFENVSFSNITIETTPTHPNSVEYPIFVDLEKRFEDSRQSHVRDINFSDITVRTKGRVLLGGMPAQPLENFTLRNIFMRVTGFEPVEKQHKPRGSSRVRPAGPETDYSPVPAAFILANMRGVKLDNVRLQWDTKETPQERHAIYAGHVENLWISGFAGRQAVPNGKLAAIGLDSVKHAFIDGNWAAPDTSVFVGLRGMPRSEVLLQGNDLRAAARDVEEGATYIHKRP